MAHLAICTNSLYGHLSPMLALAERLRARGHNLSWLLHTQDDEEAARVRAILRAEGMTLLELDGFDRQIPAADVRAAMQRDLRAYMRLAQRHGHPFYPPDAIMARQVRSLTGWLAAERPALLLTEQVASARIAATQQQLPWIFVPPGAGPWRSGRAPIRLGDALPGMGRVGRALLNWVERVGLYNPDAQSARTARLAGRPVPESSPYLNIVGSLPEWEGVTTLPDNVHFVGPLAYPFPTPPPPWWSQVAGQRCLFVSPGTSVREPRLLQTALEVLPAFGQPLVVATGGQHRPHEFEPAGTGTFLTPWVDMEALLPHCEAAVIVGGWNSALACLRHGVPSLIVPFVIDQQWAGERLEQLGAGLMLPWDQFTPATLHEAVARLLAEPTFRANAQKAGAQLRALPGAEGAADLVEGLLRGLSSAPPGGNRAGAPAPQPRGAS